jgi:hypothetical protein
LLSSDGINEPKKVGMRSAYSGTLERSEKKWGSGDRCEFNSPVVRVGNLDPILGQDRSNIFSYLYPTHPLYFKE